MSNIPAMQESVLNAKISRLYQQNNELDERIEKELYSCTDRLCKLGVSLNSIGHPSISNKTSVGSTDLGSSNGMCKTPSDSDGILGRLDTLIERNEDLLSKFNGRLLLSLMDNIEHLERNI